VYVMTFSPKIVCVSILAALSAVMLPTNIAAQNAQVRHVSVASSGGVTEVKIETSKRVMPLTQVLTDPDRLVIDFPDALPVPELHGVAAHQGEVKGVRTSLLSAKPPMTRVVIDLKSAQEFRLVPTSTSVTVKLLGASTQSTPTEVANATPPPAETSAPPAPSAVTQTAPQPAPTQPAAAQPAPSSEPVREAVAATPAAVPAPEPPRPTLTVRATQQQMAAAETPTPKASLVTTAKRPMITIERTAAAPARATLTTATVVKPAMETVAPPPAPVPPPSAPASGTAQIRKVAVLKSGGAMEIEIETSQRVVPATQLITGPDRLVLDFAGSLPGPQLRAMSVNQGQVKGVRAALLSANPPVTRVVLDLKSPQEFQLFPSTKSVVVKLPGSLAPASAPSAPAAAGNDASTGVAAAPPAPEAPKVTVTFQDGKLRLSSDKGSLADVLNEVRAQTGAEIAIPAGAEQERVVATIGPTTPRDALSQLLNGSRYNFIIVGTDADPNQLERVVLTPKANFDSSQAAPQESEPAPAPVAAMAPPPRSVRSVRRNALNTPPNTLNTPPPPPPTEVPPTDDAQPQGDSNPPPDTTPQPGDPQAPPQ
jgi:hypothetical protein